MREIKFRAWDSKKMVYLAPLEVENQNMGLILSGNIDGKPEAVMQYTGLKDKNGKDIYEGDIILCKRNGLKGTAQVIWEEHIVKNDYKGQYSTLNGYEDFGSWNIVGINESALAMHTGQFEVIGNIYENQELLKGGVEVV